MLISDLTAPISAIKGAGKTAVSLLGKKNVFSIKDLLFYFPRAYSDRTTLDTLSEAVQKGFGNVKVKIIDYRLMGNKYKKLLKIIIQDEKHTFGSLLCFNRVFLKNTLKQDQWYYITGKFQFGYNEIQSSSFEYESATDEFQGKIVPIYSLTEGLAQKQIRSLIRKALDQYGSKIEDDLPVWCIEQYKLMKIGRAIANIHIPENIDYYYKARKTIIFQDFFYQKLYMLNQKMINATFGKSMRPIEFHYKKSVLNNLSFELTAYQRDALDKIESEQMSDKVFSILLQGDVGSGKTIIALIAMLNAVESGKQAVLLVPTEVLAMQHYRSIKKMTEGLWIDIAVLKGTMPKRDKDNILQGLASGEIKILIGTHSVFSEDVVYNDLGLAVVDEQHRFGVDQRCRLLAKGEAVDMLLMTATPIPQSLALTLYGDLDIIVMKGHIDGRLPVKTWAIEDNKERIAKMHEWIKTQLDAGGRAIFVYPLIEESENSNNKNLADEYEKLKLIYSSIGCSFIFSGTPSDEKDLIIESFRNGSTKVLAATTVVEVGLDVPDATVIVVENADNYGLSTLHQLRGRVGRNNRQGYMVLVSDMDRITEEGKKRLDIISHETDGFVIAEKDLLMRGPGDFIGNRQSGVFDIKLADIKLDMNTLLEAANAAEKLFSFDPLLERPEHHNVREVFYQLVDR